MLIPVLRKVDQIVCLELSHLAPKVGVWRLSIQGGIAIVGNYTK
jgi:hypothetical protein